jgi:Na+-driven multidrug efflux pump/anti-sigma regulatory factor (Ser/Thr protein kinase)
MIDVSMINHQEGDSDMKKTSEEALLTKLYFRLLPYQVLLLIINALTGIVDSLFASNFIGKVAMSAIGYYSPLNHFLFAVSITLVSGSQLLVGEAMGKNDMDSVNKFFSTDVIAAVVIGITTSIILALCALTNFTQLFIPDQTERSAMNLYLIGQAFGIPALVLGQQFFAFLSLENQTKRTMVASFICIITNTIMDAVLVVYLKLGTLGLGLGTALGMWGFLITMGLFYLSGKSEMKFLGKVFSFSDSIHIIKRGYPGALSRFVEMFRCFIINALILTYVGSVGLSAFAAVNSVMAVFWPLPYGMLAVTRMLFGITIGEQDRRSLQNINRIVLVKCTIFQVLVAMLIVALGTPLTQMFYRDMSDPVYNMTLMGFRILPLCMGFSVWCLHFGCYGQAMQKKGLSHVLPIMDGAVFVIACSILLIPIMKMNGLYVANVLNGVLCCSFIVIYAAACLRRLPRNLDELLVIPDEFGVSDDERIDISITQIEEVTAISEQVVDFCRKKNIDEKRAFYAGLALEEMAGNVVEHGFTKDTEKHSIDIRIVHKNNDIILRIKDNCRAFNPLERTTILQTDEITKNVGIRLVNKIAKEMNYQSLLGLNVLTIKI